MGGHSGKASCQVTLQQKLEWQESHVKIRNKALFFGRKSKKTKVCLKDKEKASMAGMYRQGEHSR